MAGKEDNSSSYYTALWLLRYERLDHLYSIPNKLHSHNERSSCGQQTRPGSHPSCLLKKSAVVLMEVELPRFRMRLQGFSENNHMYRHYLVKTYQTSSQGLNSGWYVIGVHPDPRFFSFKSKEILPLHRRVISGKCGPGQPITTSLWGTPLMMTALIPSWSALVENCVLVHESSVESNMEIKMTITFSSRSSTSVLQRATSNLECQIDFLLFLACGTLEWKPANAEQTVEPISSGFFSEDVPSPQIEKDRLLFDGTVGSLWECLKFKARISSGLERNLKSSAATPFVYSSVILGWTSPEWLPVEANKLGHQPSVHEKCYMGSSLVKTVQSGNVFQWLGYLLLGEDAQVQTSP